MRISVEAPEGTQIAPTEFIGVDFGVVNLATDNDGDVYTSTETEKARQKQNLTARRGNHYRSANSHVRASRK